MPTTDPQDAGPPKPLSLSHILGEQLDRAAGDTRDLDQEGRIRTLLLQRPHFSVKARLTLSFSVVFVITATASVANWYILSKIDHSVAIVASTEMFTHEVQEARRYEKNFFLYRSDLGTVVRHIQKADEMLQQASSDIRPVVGTDELKQLRLELQTYRGLIDQLVAMSAQSGFDESPEFRELEGALRDHGSKMLSHAFMINEAERRQISASISLTKKAAIAQILVLLALCVYVGVHVYRHIIARLERLMDATTRFARGEFAPILPVRKYKDEFSNVAIALNHMMYELERRQKILVESHKIRAVGNLTAGVAHELNNPLNNIMLTSEMLKEDWAKLSDPARLEMVDELTEQAERARSIVKNLLDFARETEAKVEHLGIDKLLDEVLRLAHNQLRINKIKLHVDVDDHLPPVYGDRNLLVQVFLNLILNAIDAMPHGGHLILRVTEEKDTGFVSIHVQDTGVGIPAHLLPSIFDPFFTTKPTGRGTGLGLSVSQGIVSQHGGQIEVMSKVGVGTTFTVHLPCVPVPAELARKPPELSPPPAPPHATSDPTAG
ncbi:MAG: HAMP domain-containing sensor histidine kinase [Planctomycetota bacterium]